MGAQRRSIVSLLIAMNFVILAISGVLAFLQPFSIGIIGLHALMGFVFIPLIGLHISNNIRTLIAYFRSKTMWIALLITLALTAIFWWQPTPVRTILGWSRNLGPALERFEIGEAGMIFDYAPSLDYRMRLTVEPGPAYEAESLPNVAIWLENQGGYHIKTLVAPKNSAETPLWAFKRAGWEKARRRFEELEAVDAVSSATSKGSFDPADYIIPRPSGEVTPYQLLLEINQPNDDQGSLIYTVEIDNSLPKRFQLLELRGYPKREDVEGKDSWGIYYINNTYTSALELIDSALLTIERNKKVQ